MPYSRWIRVVLAPLRWWVVHPWAVLWLTYPVTMVVWSNTELLMRHSRSLRAFMVAVMVVGSVSFALGLRLSWHKSRVRASLIAACLALCALFPLVFFDVTQFVVLIALIIGEAVGLEHAARARPLRALLEVPIAPPLLVPCILIPLAWIVALGVYPAWKIGAAHSRAEALCAAAVVGGPVAGLQAKGEDLGLAVWSLPAGPNLVGKVRPATIEGMSGWIFARWFCTIEHEDGKVLSKRVDFLD